MRDLGMIILSFIIIAGFFIVSFMVLDGDIKLADPQVVLLIGTVFGSASTHAGSVISYWFGTSKSSADKDKTVAAAVAATETKPKS